MLSCRINAENRRSSPHLATLHFHKTAAPLGLGWRASDFVFFLIFLVDLDLVEIFLRVVSGDGIFGGEFQVAGDLVDGVFIWEP